jgi:hypothetical protein
MKKPALLLLLFFSSVVNAQDSIRNLIIVTIDGFRWQEVFEGMDSIIAANEKFNTENETHVIEKYWSKTKDERRKKLLPFFWNTIGQEGQLYGNRNEKSIVSVSNPFWFSYPGYSEMFCGYVDKKVNSNEFSYNPNTNVLEFIHQQPGFSGKVAAFAAWAAFDKILNEPRSKFPVISGIDSVGSSQPDSIERWINARKKEKIELPFDEQEYPDYLTHSAAFHYLKKNKPRVLFIGYGETDSWAHAGQYARYLNAAHQFDTWMGELWNFIQSDPFYKNNTALFITVDHGRGDKRIDDWTNHNRRTAGSGDIWFAVIGPGISPKGEVKNSPSLKQNQFAQTWANLLNLEFKCEHRVAKGFKKLLTEKQ